MMNFNFSVSYIFKGTTDFLVLMMFADWDFRVFALNKASIVSFAINEMCVG